MISKRDKIVLVRPQGGLNDTLMQIEKCCKYAELSGRRVVVDTNYHGSSTFHDVFSNYFTSRQRGLILDSAEIDLDLESDVFPKFLAGQINTYQVFDRLMSGTFRELTSLEPITFDFEKNYSEQVLVHHQMGGGDSIHFFQRVVLTDDLKEKLSERLERLGPHYDGIHIRNTDYRTNFRKFIDNSVSKSLFKNKRIFLATDSEEALTYFKNNVKDILYLETTQADLSGNIPIHNRRVFDPVYWKRNNSSAIVDMLTLAYSSSISAPPLENLFIDGKHIKSINFSGFARLAQSLKTNRPLLTQFTGIHRWLD